MVVQRQSGGRPVAGEASADCRLMGHDAYFDDYEGYLEELEAVGRPPDSVERRAVEELRAFFEANQERVFSSRQIEIQFEDQYFHWITHRAVKVLADEGLVLIEGRTLASGAPINFVWHRRNRYTRRQVKEVQEIVERYSHPDFTAALGNTGELLVSDGFGRFGFVQRGRDTRAFRERAWTKSAHNLDFLVERDEVVYGVEVKNTLPYISDRELNIKLALCDHLGISPVFVVRAMPKIWIQEVARRGGFTLVLKYHLYPLSHRGFAMEVKEKLGLPVDAPKALHDGTMQRFVAWHDRKSGRG